MKADLHLHTTASDGGLTPAELVTRSANLGLKVIAVTDHDSVEGIPTAVEAARNYPQITLIPGVEISTDIPKNEIHMLGYFMDCKDKKLNDELSRLRISRQTRAEKMAARLTELGLPIDYARVLQLAGDGSVGRPHIAQAMLENGHIDDFRQAFDSYIGRNGPAYVEREKMLPEEAVALIAKAGGLPALAHPADIEDIKKLLPLYIEHGLVGLETYYYGYNEQTVKRLAGLADQYGLIATGGSDYHNDNGTAGGPLGGVDIPRKSIDRLLSLAREKGLI
ncbi:PHP domain-containing protein [Chloroflexota bacterium]